RTTTSSTSTSTTITTTTATATTAATAATAATATTATATAATAATTTTSSTTKAKSKVNAAPIVYNTPESKVSHYHCDQNSAAYSDNKCSSLWAALQNGWLHALAEEFEVQASKAHVCSSEGLYEQGFKKWLSRAS
ncbi:hypothetical protein HDU80_001450, partial [Chytriomyces hyalinus]